MWDFILLIFKFVNFWKVENTSNFSNITNDFFFYYILISYRWSPVVVWHIRTNHGTENASLVHIARQVLQVHVLPVAKINPTAPTVSVNFLLNVATGNFILHLQFMHHSCYYVNYILFTFLIYVGVTNQLPALAAQSLSPSKTDTGTMTVSTAQVAVPVWSDVVSLQIRMISSVQSVPSRSWCKELA